jgi:hypothetical protein
VERLAGGGRGPVGPVGARVQFPAGTDDTTSDAREFLPPRIARKRPSRISSSFGMGLAFVPAPSKGDLSGIYG